VHTNVGWLNVRRCKRCNICSDPKFENLEYTWDNEK
jgi:hypothetical protein